MQVLEVNILPQGIVPAPVEIDGEGLLPDSLEAAIQRVIADTGRPPKVLYVVPNSHNPTGCSMSMARKRAAYAACQRHNIVIVEDDPYIYLKFPEAGDEMPGTPPSPCCLLCRAAPRGHAPLRAPACAHSLCPAHAATADQPPLLLSLPSIRLWHAWGHLGGPASMLRRSHRQSKSQIARNGGRRVRAGLEVEPGFLHLDTDGRVLRLDSFSKILAPGLRLGWVSGSPTMLHHVKCATSPRPRPPLPPSWRGSA